MIDSILVQTKYTPDSLLPESATNNTLIAYQPSMMVTILLFFVGSAIIYRLGLKRTSTVRASSVSVTTASPAPISQSTPRPAPPIQTPVYNTVIDDDEDETDDDDDDWDMEIEDATSADELMASLNKEFDIDGMLREAGLGSLPGTAAEVLDDEVRSILCPDKVNTEQWFAVMEAAHDAGIRTTSTIMYGHVERPVHCCLLYTSDAADE